MLNYTTPIYHQVVVVLDSSSKMPNNATASWAPTVQVQLSATGFIDSVPQTETVTMRTTFSSVPVVWEAELKQQYRELGNALNEMTQLEEGDEWKIEPSVYNAACYVARWLMDNSFPAPRIFNHGTKSVVFNWSEDTDNMYFTVSANHLSALISSPERIQRRVEYSLNELMAPSVALPAIRAEYFKKPSQRVLTGRVSDPSEFVG